MKTSVWLCTPACIALHGEPWLVSWAPCRSPLHLSVTLLADRAFIHAHSWIFNLLLLQGYKRCMYTQERRVAVLSLPASFNISLFLFSLLLPMSLYMYKLNISSSVQALISCTCFIRSVNRETFFPRHFEQANTILHRLCERKILFVLCQHKHFNLKLSLLSKQQISSEAQGETEN